MVPKGELAPEAGQDTSPMLGSYLGRASAKRRILEAPELLLANVQRDASGCREVATQVLKHDLWEGEEVVVDGVIDVHVSPEAMKAAREVFRIFSYSHPAAAGELLNEVPSEIREVALQDWAKSAPELPIEQLELFLAPLGPDQQKAAGWLLVEEVYYSDPSKVATLAGLSRVLPDNPTVMASKIAQFRPTRVQK